MIKLPRYYDYNMNSFKIVEAPGGGLRGYILDLHTGKFRIANSLLRKVLFSMGEDISPSSESDFIELTEENRSQYLTGTGPIFAIYKAIDDLFKQRDSLDEATWRNKREFISELRRRTFEMWEEEFANQATGEAPSFECGSVAGPAAVEKFSRIDATPDLSTPETDRWFRELGRIRANFDRAFNEEHQPPE